jgi:hypothetical protein
MPRPRKAGPREPNGRPQRNIRTSYWQRQRDELVRGSLDARLGTPLGVLYRDEQITTAQMEAGSWFAEARSLADGALGLPPRTCPAQDVGRVRGLSGGEEDEVAKRRAIEAYDRAVAFIGYGSRELAALELVAVYQRRPDSHEQLLALMAALTRLVAFRTGRRAA